MDSSFVSLSTYYAMGVRQCCNGKDKRVITRAARLMFSWFLFCNNIFAPKLRIIFCSKIGGRKVGRACSKAETPYLRERSLQVRMSGAKQEKWGCRESKWRGCILLLTHLMEGRALNFILFSGCFWLMHYEASLPASCIQMLYWDWCKMKPCLI